MNEQHNKTRTSTYTSWYSMKHRCLNENSVDYKHYGGRGIIVCPTWISSFNTFYNDMGERPSMNHSIDRINNNKGYNKNNCKWSTHKEQNRNRRDTLYILYKNDSKSLAEWCDILNLDYKKVYKKIKQGKTLEHIIKYHICI